MKDPETLYARWLVGTLSQDEEDALKASGEWQELQAIINATSDLSLPQYDKERAFSAIQKKNKPRSSSLRPLWTAISVAASVILVVGLYFTLSPDTITLFADQKTNLTYQLPDASSFILNDGSSISFDAKSYEDSRTLTLTGEAFFDVEKGSEFMVKTDKGDVTVLGTTFNVRSWDDIIKVECYSGSVRVESQGQNVTLQAGEGTETESDGSWGKVTLTRQGPDWQNNTSDFTSTDVTKVLEEMERQFAVSIRYEGPVQRFSGAFTHTDIEAALQQVSIPLSLTISKEGEDMYLVK